jgi:hypothetical protein
MISSSKSFARKSAIFSRQLYNRHLDPMLCISGDWIYRILEISEKMYFIDTGIVTILGRDEHLQIAVLDEG